MHLDTGTTEKPKNELKVEALRERGMLAEYARSMSRSVADKPE